MTLRVGVIGAGAGGLAAAIELARAGAAVTVLERAAVPGGKMRSLNIAGQAVDAGPTVFTMRWVFDGLFAGSGTDLDTALELHTPEILARHYWRSGGELDLHADIDTSAAAIARFAGDRDADGYRRFTARAADIYSTLRDSFMAAQRPSALALTGRVGISGLPGLWRTQPWRSLWSALGDYFSDPRLRQLFARYATYVGSSPLAAPATLMLIAHVEQAGVWQLRDGMVALARALGDLAEGHGARLRFGTGVTAIHRDGDGVTGVSLDSGENLNFDALVFNGDAQALADGLLGPAASVAVPAIAPRDRGLSAHVWCLNTPVSGVELDYHTVLFNDDYPAEFDAIFDRHELPDRPTVYLCAQDRFAGARPTGPERLLVLANAPPSGARGSGAAITTRVTEVLGACGVDIRLDPPGVRTGPEDFARLFPGSRGSLYGRSTHGMFGSFARPGSRAKVRGLYLAGGSVHPGPGVPMSTLSGRLAARALLADAGIGSGWLQ